MVFKVNGGIINDQTLTGSLRFFKMVGAANQFDWTISDGTVNLPVSVTGDNPGITTYFQVGNGRPVPNSAAELALREISSKADITMIGLDAVGDATTTVYFACSASSIGWGSDTPAYDVPPANADLTTAACAAQMQAAVQALPNATVYITVGAGVPSNQQAPVSAVVAFGAITVTEVPFKLV
jgi:hypothetical protein